jgi:hypothetical protein
MVDMSGLVDQLLFEFRFKDSLPKIVSYIFHLINNPTTYKGRLEDTLVASHGGLSMFMMK